MRELILQLEVFFSFKRCTWPNQVQLILEDILADMKDTYKSQKNLRDDPYARMVYGAPEPVLNGSCITINLECWDGHVFNAIEYAKDWVGEYDFGTGPKCPDILNVYIHTKVAVVPEDPKPNKRTRV